MKKQKHTAILTTLALTGLLSAQGAVMISHTFDDAGGSLNGDSLDVNNIGASTWTSNTGITDDGAIDVTGKGSAYIDLGANLASGSADNVYTLDMLVQTTGGAGFLTGGFWGAEPNAASNDHEDNLGSPWWFWRPNNELDVSTGQPYSADIFNGTASTASAKTLRFVLDLTDATLANNTVSFWVDGVQQGSTENFSGDEGFRYVGIGANTGEGTITSLTLSDLAPEPVAVPEPTTMVLLGMGGLAIYWRRMTANA